MDEEILSSVESESEEEVFPNDKVKECAESYQYLVEQRVEYLIKLFADKQVYDLKLIFTTEKFKHLTEIEKIKELQEANYLADEFYAAAKEGVFTYQHICEGAKDYFFDDTGKIEEEIKSMKGELPHGAVGKNELLDRLTALESIYDLFEGLKPDEDGNKEYTLEVYQWDKKLIIQTDHKNPEFKLIFCLNSTQNLLLKFKNRLQTSSLLRRKIKVNMSECRFSTLN